MNRHRTLSLLCHAGIWLGLMAMCYLFGSVTSNSFLIRDWDGIVLISYGALAAGLTWVVGGIALDEYQNPT